MPDSLVDALVQLLHGQSSEYLSVADVEALLHRLGVAIGGVSVGGAQLVARHVRVRAGLALGTEASLAAVLHKDNISLITQCSRVVAEHNLSQQVMRDLPAEVQEQVVTWSSSNVLLSDGSVMDVLSGRTSALLLPREEVSHSSVALFAGWYLVSRASPRLPVTVRAPRDDQYKPWLLRCSSNAHLATLHPRPILIVSSRSGRVQIWDLDAKATVLSSDQADLDSDWILSVGVVRRARPFHFLTAHWNAVCAWQEGESEPVARLRSDIGRVVDLHDSVDGQTCWMAAELGLYLLDTMALRPIQTVSYDRPQLLQVLHVNDARRLLLNGQSDQILALQEHPVWTSCQYVNQNIIASAAVPVACSRVILLLERPHALRRRSLIHVFDEHSMPNMLPLVTWSVQASEMQSVGSALRMLQPAPLSAAAPRHCLTCCNLM